MRGYHDLGGVGGGPIDRTQHDYALWEKRVDAMMFLLIGKGVFTSDESRHHIETMGADTYERLTYYEQWMVSIVKALQARGVITTDELGRKIAEVANRETP